MENNSKMGNVNNFDKGFRPGSFAADFNSILNRFEINKYSKEINGSNFTFDSEIYSDMKHSITKLATHLAKTCKTEREVELIVAKTRTEIKNLIELIKVFLKINSGDKVGQAYSIDGLIDELEDAALPENYINAALKHLNALKKLGTDINLLGKEAKALITKAKADVSKEENVDVEAFAADIINGLIEASNLSKDEVLDNAISFLVKLKCK